MLLKEKSLLLAGQFNSTGANGIVSRQLMITPNPRKFARLAAL